VLHLALPCLSALDPRDQQASAGLWSPRLEVVSGIAVQQGVFLLQPPPVDSTPQNTGWRKPVPRLRLQLQAGASQYPGSGHKTQAGASQHLGVSHNTQAGASQHLCFGYSYRLAQASTPGFGHNYRLAQASTLASATKYRLVQASTWLPGL